MFDTFLDKEFLYQLDQYRHKELYARIISLNFEEQPLECIEGRVTSGSVNIDGNSAVRRTCNLSLIAKELNINDFYWGVSNKFTLEIGVKNFINPDYPDIIWFKQGVFVITSFNAALANNNYTVSISGKDKMCLLNGDIGGSLHSSIDFGKIDTYTDTFSKVQLEDYTQYKANKYYVYDIDTNSYIISLDEYNENTQYYEKDILLKQESLKLKDIIKEAIHTYGKEMYHNIIINDLDDYGLELLEYRGDSPMYLLYDEYNSIYDQMIMESDAKKTQVQLKDGGTKFISECILNNAVDKLNEDREIFYFQIGIDDNNNPIYKEYSATKIEYGQASGYREVDLTYAGDLISSIGESLTSILDKIKSMLGAFEYFYDVDGHFIFQMQKTYDQNSWNTLQDVGGNVFARDAVEESPYSYSFEDVNLIQKFQNTPTINNIKNDYSVWGMRKTASGGEIPIHARYAIHEKPEYYKAFDGRIYCANPSIIENLKAKKKEEIIYEFNNKIQNFTLMYPIPYSLESPKRLANGAWTAGWWDIRDWYEYYQLLTDEIPCYTMKWYSYNSLEGCVQTKTISGYEHADPKSCCWLIIERKDGSFNLQHGQGIPDPTYLSTRTLYKSEYIDEESGKYTTYIVRDEDGNPITKKFMRPYSGCSDNHTYIEFLEGDIKRDGNKVYFYNPNFPNAASFEDLVEERINAEFEEYIASGELQFVDWREIIYQMAKDYYQHNQESDFLIKIRKNSLDVYGNSYYPTGETGYEAFYSDIQGFWRQLYDPNPTLTYDTSGGEYIEVKEFEEDGKTYRIKKQWQPFIQEETFSCDYYLKGEQNDENYSNSKYYWNKNVVNAPELLNFWMDFYEGDVSLSQYSISNIGNRSKVINNSKVNSIYFRDIPQIIFITGRKARDIDRKTGYTYIQLEQNLEGMFSISAQGKSAEDEINELINKYSYCTEGVNLTTIPIYHLQPNELIFIHNEENGINGKYQVNRITLPLTYNGTMSVTATKVINPIY